MFRSALSVLATSGATTLWLGPVKAPSISLYMTTEGPAIVVDAPPRGGPALDFRADAETVEAAPLPIIHNLGSELNDKIPGAQTIK